MPFWRAWICNSKSQKQDQNSEMTSESRGSAMTTNTTPAKRTICANA